MKTTRILLLCLSLVLALTLCLCLGSCNEDPGNEKESEKSTTQDTVESTKDTAPETVTEAPTETETDAPATEPDTTPDDPGEETTGEEEESKGYSREDFPEDEYIVIENVADLMAFNNFINEDLEEVDGKTVVFLNDIDLAGQNWIPLLGDFLYDVTFDGMGHTIKNMHIDYNTERDITGTESELGCGFVGTVAAGNFVTFQNITFEDCTVTARERHVGCLVGRSIGGTCTFENVTVRNFTVDGWMDYNNTSEENDGYPICFRVAGVMGATWGGAHTFTNVTVDGLNISGFHNLAGILGYDASGVIDEYSFENCKVENAKMYFSYCLSSSYTVDMPRKFVSVFFNGAGWVDNIDQCVENGNTYSNVSFFDWTDNNAEYTPADFRSWTQEEKDAAS